MSSAAKDHKNYHRIAKAINYLVDHQFAQPTLPEISDAVGISQFHLQRTFSEWVGVSPKQFIQYLTKEQAKLHLRDNSVFDAALSSGLSGGGRLHDLLITCESVTPGEYKTWGAGLEISYGTHTSRFGYCFIATTRRGICKLAFFDSQEQENTSIKELVSDWPNATIKEDKIKTAAILLQIFSQSSSNTNTLNVLLKGSKFQLQVWEALLKIPESEMVSYQQVANGIGKPSSVRALASAIGRNNIAYLIPCHRVIRSTGALSHYRWGDNRKVAMLGWEGRDKMAIRNSDLSRIINQT